jgi:tRNA 2-thiouridine synthesizing protein A
MEKIDERGKVGPIPLFHTKRKIESMKSGEEVEIIANDPSEKKTIPRWSNEHGHDIVSIADHGDHFRIVIRKG